MADPNKYTDNPGQYLFPLPLPRYRLCTFYGTNPANNMPRRRHPDYIEDRPASTPETLPRMTKDLMLAYRIFGPGLRSTEKLEGMFYDIIQDPARRWEVVFSLGMGSWEQFSQVTRASKDVYKAEIIRMQEVEELQASEKQASEKQAAEKQLRNKEIAANENANTVGSSELQLPKWPRENTAWKSRSDSKTESGAAWEEVMQKRRNLKRKAFEPAASTTTSTTDHDVSAASPAMESQSTSEDIPESKI